MKLNIARVTSSRCRVSDILVEVLRTHRVRVERSLVLARRSIIHRDVITVIARRAYSNRLLARRLVRDELLHGFVHLRQPLFERRRLLPDGRQRRRRREQFGEHVLQLRLPVGEDLVLMRVERVPGDGDQDEEEVERVSGEVHREEPGGVGSVGERFSLVQRHARGDLDSLRRER